jgi:hypothetical protein
MQFPHWVVNGQKVTSQFNAWKLAVEQNTVPHFYFYEDEYDTLDWTQEPTASWEQLCYDRCMQLRLRYKKLGLFYSAGRDSHHILRCFYNFNIPLDEIILMNIPAHVLPDRHHELVNYIHPQVRRFVEAYPNTKVFNCNFDTNEFNTYFADDWLEHSAMSLAHGYFQPANFSYFAKEFMHAKDDPDYGIILGVDKPRLLLEDGKYYSTVLDKTMEVHNPDIPNVELFYYSPTMPEMHLKQSWMTLNFIERKYGAEKYKAVNTDKLLNGIIGSAPTDYEVDKSANIKNLITPEFLREFCGNSHSDYYDDLCIACGRGEAWDLSLSIQNGKSKRKANGRESVYSGILKTAIDEKWVAATNYLDAMSYLEKNYSSIFNKGDPYQGTIGVFAKRYYMKDATIND